ncbi:hypothetical protein NONI108955_01320 [Nocardia ninae]|uniref:Uncharacterized protein n=1 Tax=Nocardia ninae NBRC 108245 TaxID=1210091 RepID=A0A511MCA3_9NOCA|nr:hypothetical protein [Nocardia ninae]GEM38219.1 hypothetical protein NN4_27380 [Nocardia ninae NBRC 108245]
MAYAVLHADDLGGYIGPARCYRLDPPVRLGGTDHEYVTVWVQPGLPHQQAEVGVVAATSTGACATWSMLRQPGSFVLHGDPDTDDYLDGCYTMALGLLGYQLGDAPTN